MVNGDSAMRVAEVERVSEDVSATIPPLHTVETIVLETVQR